MDLANTPPFLRAAQVVGSRYTTNQGVHLSSLLQSFSSGECRAEDKRDSGEERSGIPAVHRQQAFGSVQTSGVS